MAMENYGSQSPESRQYTRLDSVFPVQFRLAALDGRNFLSDWQRWPIHILVTLSALKKYLISSPQGQKKQKGLFLRNGQRR